MKRKNFTPGKFLWSAGKYASNVGKRVAINYAKKYAKSYIQNGQQKRSSPPALTNQHDYVRVYTKKRMPKYKRKAWVGFVKKVNAVNTKDRGLITALFNKSITAPAVTNEQAVICCHLYGYNGDNDSVTTEAGQNDLYTIVFNNQDLRGENVYDASGNLIIRAGQKLAMDKIIFESAIMDVTITNPTVYTMEVDIYYIVYNKFNKVTEDSLRTGFISGDTDDVNLVQFTTGTSSTLANITLQNRGATPFEMGAVIGRHGIKILKKEKFYLGGGQAVNKQIRDARNRYFDLRGLSAEATSSSKAYTCYKYGNLTQSLLIIAKNTDSTVSGCRVNAGVTRTYKYTYEGLKVNKNYFANV